MKAIRFTLIRSAAACLLLTSGISLADDGVVRLSDKSSRGVVRIRDGRAAAVTPVRYRDSAQETVEPAPAPDAAAAHSSAPTPVPETAPAAVYTDNYSGGVEIPAGPGCGTIGCGDAGCGEAGCGDTGCGEAGCGDTGCGECSCGDGGCNGAGCGCGCGTGGCNTYQRQGVGHRGGTNFRDCHNERMYHLFAGSQCSGTGCPARDWWRGQSMSFQAKNTRLGNHLFGWMVPSGCNGQGCPPVGKYRVTYADQPDYIDGRDTQQYAAQGYGMPMTVPLAPTVRYTYNYSSSLPSSRVTQIGTYNPMTSPQPLYKQTW